MNSVAKKILSLSETVSWLLDCDQETLEAYSKRISKKQKVEFESGRGECLSEHPEFEAYLLNVKFQNQHMLTGDATSLSAIEQEDIAWIWKVHDMELISELDSEVGLSRKINSLALSSHNGGWVHIETPDDLKLHKALQYREVVDTIMTQEECTPSTPFNLLRSSCLLTNLPEETLGLIAKKLLPQLKEKEKRQCLAFASEVGNVKMLKVLLDLGLKVESSEDSFSPILIAEGCNQKESLAALTKAQERAKAHKGTVELVKESLSAVDLPSASPYQPSEPWAQEALQYREVQDIIKMQGDFSKSTPFNMLRSSCLLTNLSQETLCWIAKPLLPRLTEKEKRQCLAFACEVGNVKMLKALLDLGLKVESSEDTFSPILIAGLCNQKEILTALEAAHEWPGGYSEKSDTKALFRTIKKKVVGRNALMSIPSACQPLPAVDKRLNFVIEKLSVLCLIKTQTVEVQNQIQCSVAHYLSQLSGIPQQSLALKKTMKLAAEFGNLEMIRILDLSAKEIESLNSATKYSHIKISPNDEAIYSHDELSPIFIAALRGQGAAVEKLLFLGADKEASFKPNNSARWVTDTAFTIALKNGYHKVAAMLLRHGASPTPTSMLGGNHFKVFIEKLIKLERDGCPDLKISGDLLCDMLRANPLQLFRDNSQCDFAKLVDQGGDACQSFLWSVLIDPTICWNFYDGHGNYSHNGLQGFLKRVTSHRAATVLSKFLDLLGRVPAAKRFLDTVLLEAQNIVAKGNWPAGRTLINNAILERARSKGVFI